MQNIKKILMWEALPAIALKVASVLHLYPVLYYLVVFHLIFDH